MDTSKLESRPFYRGAEADLSLSMVGHWPAVVKHRIRKAYRNHELDESIRRERTFSEASIMHDAKLAGVRVPSIIGVDEQNTSIVMTRVDGMVARECLDGMSRRDAGRLFESVGEQIGLLHLAGIVHGDLTTSNIIVTPAGLPFVVDFGMSRRSVEPEDRGVDLHLLQRSIATSHLKDPSTLIKTLSRGYGQVTGRAMMEASWAKAREIARRGRYFAIR